MLKRQQRGWSKRRSGFHCGRRCYYDAALAVAVAVAVEVSKWLQHFAVICTINLGNSCGCFVVVAIIAVTLVRLWIFHWLLPSALAIRVGAFALLDCYCSCCSNIVVVVVWTARIAASDSKTSSTSIAFLFVTLRLYAITALMAFAAITTTIMITAATNNNKKSRILRLCCNHGKSMSKNFIILVRNV